MYDERLLNLITADRNHLVRAASRLLGTADAEDAVQDAYVRALEADTPTLNSTQAWLLTVVRNLAIDRLRRRQWMAQWLAETNAAETTDASPSAEMDAALVQEATLALQMLAACLTPADGAAVLLLELFEASHAEIAQASGKTEANSRQQLRRALLRLRQSRARQTGGLQTELEPPEEAAFHLYLQSLLLRDPHTLWAMLRQPPISAYAGVSHATTVAEPAQQGLSCGVMQVGGQLGLVLTLDGVRLCVVPLGTHREPLLAE
jgi:RNA polymerase sigma-70 factor (ECF subfamily)